jgi:glycosyltransferase involved in cell wall biosynthesis
MRILLVTGSYPPMHCGVGDYTGRLAGALACRAGVEVAVLTSRAAAVSGRKDANVELFALLEDWTVREVPKVFAVLRGWRPDIVHIQYPTQGYGRGRLPLLLPLLFRMARVSVVQTWHECRTRLTPGALAWLLCQLPVAGGVIIVRPRLAEMMPRLLRAAFANKIRRFIPNGPAMPRARLEPEERERIRGKVGRPGAAILLYFGFIYPEKGVDRIFDLADPEKDHIVLVGERSHGAAEAYYESLLATADSAAWRGRVTVMGFLPTADAARTIAAADAVVLPFVSGGGEWNTSIQSAQVQGTFVLTTSVERNGYDESCNTYFSAPGDTDSMRAALRLYVGRRLQQGVAGDQLWSSICDAHLDLYRALGVETYCVG